MHRSRLRIAFLIASGAIALLPGTAALASSHRPKCVPSAGRGVPVQISPCNRAVVRAGRGFVFRVRDLNSEAKQYPPYLNLTKQEPRHGVLKDDNGSHGMFAETRALRGHPGTYVVHTEGFSFPGYWLVTPGTYYVQLQQIGFTGRLIYSPVETITVR